MGLKIFYVDDEPELCEVFEELFSTEEISVETFTDPFKVLEKTISSPPDVVFMDYRMPGLNGLELARKMPVEIKKYLISGENNLVVDYPFEEILYKPFEIAHIRELLKQFKKS